MKSKEDRKSKRITNDSGMRGVKRKGEPGRDEGMKGWREQWMVSKSAVTSKHLRASLFSVLCLASVHTTGSTGIILSQCHISSQRNLPFPASMASVSVLGTGTNILYLGTC